eukprot:403335052
METVFNRPKQMNAIDIDVQLRMLSMQKFWHENPDQIPRYMLMYGAGDKAFCAGGDIKYANVTCDTQQKWHHLFRTYHLIIHQLRQMKKPFHIVFYNGYAAGGASGYSINAPIRIATEKTLFTMPEVQIGYLTDSGATYYFSRLCGKSLGMHLGVTGRKVYGKDLVKYGLATHFVEHQNLEKLRQELIHNLKADTPESEAYRIVEKYNIPIEDKTIENIDQINEIYQYDSYKAAYKRLMKSNTKFAKSIQQQMIEETHSPLSHALIYELIKKGSEEKTYREGLFNEFRAQMAFWESNEFKEGTRAKLVDRDNNPRWKHKSVDQVPIEDVEHFTQYPLRETIDEVYTMERYCYWNDGNFKPFNLDQLK